jgi:hypothetical protein
VGPDLDVSVLPGQGMDASICQEGADHQLSARWTFEKLVADENLVLLEDHQDFLAEQEACGGEFKNGSRHPAEGRRGGFSAGQSSRGNGAEEGMLRSPH